MAQSIPLQESWQPMEHEEVMFRLKTQGWVIIPSVIPHDEVEPIRRDMERVYAERGRSRVDYILNYLDHSSHSFSKYLADPRILAPVHEAFGGQHVRVRSNAGFLNPPPADVDDAMVRRAQHKMAQGMHADGPFLQGQPVRVAAPYQDSAVQFTTIWMLSDFTEENGATQLLTGSHRSPTNPTAIRAFDPTNLSEVVAARMGDLTRPDPAIVTAAGKAGDVILFDNRVWHKGGINISTIPRIGLIMVYFPWWLSQDQNRPPGTVQRELIKAETGYTDEQLGPGTPLLPRASFDAMADECKTLVRHWLEPLEHGKL